MVYCNFFTPLNWASHLQNTIDSSMFEFESVFLGDRIFVIGGLPPHSRGCHQCQADCGAGKWDWVGGPLHDNISERLCGWVESRLNLNPLIKTYQNHPVSFPWLRKEGFVPVWGEQFIQVRNLIVLLPWSTSLTPRRLLKQHRNQRWETRLWRNLACNLVKIPICYSFNSHIVYHAPGTPPNFTLDRPPMALFLTESASVIILQGGQVHANRPASAKVISHHWTN